VRVLSTGVHTLLTRFSPIGHQRFHTKKDAKASGKFG
jgi:hypothetical protein